MKPAILSSLLVVLITGCDVPSFVSKKTIRPPSRLQMHHVQIDGWGPAYILTDTLTGNRWLVLHGQKWSIAPFPKKDVEL